MPLTDAIAQLTKQTGLVVELTSTVPRSKIIVGTDPVPFWQALETIATASKCRIELRDKEGVAGKGITLLPAGNALSRVAIDGPFQMSVREVRAQTQFDTGRSEYLATIEVNWEPRFEVFRLQSEPTITRAVDNLGHQLAFAPSQAAHPVSGYTTLCSTRLLGLTRKASSIASLEGSFQVIATPGMLPYRFRDLHSNKPESLEKERVQVTFRGLKKDLKLWSATLDLRYPNGSPTIESFEYDNFLRANELLLIDPNGKQYAIPNVEVGGSSVTYRFEEGKEVGKLPADLKGWEILYTTPAPLREFAVKFRLRDIPLP